MKIMGIGLLLLFTAVGHAGCYPLNKSNMVGSNQFVSIQAGDNFVALAERYDVGYDQLQAANPNLDAEHPQKNAVAIIPGRVMIPTIKHRGIVVNLSQMRLFYFPPNKKQVCTYPVGIGQENWSTPLGQLFVMQKMKNPVWIVPDSVMAYRKKRGDPVSKVMQSGPDNPLGYYALRLSLPTYLIHGTNEPDSIGRRSSAGCIHLFGKDIESLFAMVAVKTPVRIIDQPYVYAKQGKQIWLAAYPLLKELKKQWGAVGQRAALKQGLQQVLPQGPASYWADAQAVASQPTGMPVLLYAQSPI